MDPKWTQNGECKMERIPQSDIDAVVGLVLFVIVLVVELEFIGTVLRQYSRTGQFFLRRKEYIMISPIVRQFDLTDQFRLNSIVLNLFGVCGHNDIHLAAYGLISAK